MKWALIGVLCFSPLIGAAPEENGDDWGGILWGPGSSDSSYVEEKKGKWRESDVEFPEFPDFEAMIPLPVSTSSNSFQYFVDPDAFSLDKKDEITRYTIILESRSGATRNVFYEGVLCSSNAYRVIATGTPGGRFEPTPKLGPWNKIQKEGVMAYRWALVEQYICDAKQSVPADEIADRIRYDRPTNNGIDENF